MNAEINRRIHWSFWLIGVLALLWHVMGVANYLMQMDSDMLSTYPESAQLLAKNRPSWATGAFAIAVFVGAIASVTMLFKRSFSYYLFIVSLIGVIATNIHTFGMEVSTDILVGSALSVVVGVFLIWYSLLAKRKSWLH